MIYTVTLNPSPSLDYIVEMNDITLGALNRTKNEAILPGGKGINVSQVLKTFETPNQALGFVGGFTGDYIETLLHTLDIETNFIRVNEQTRINVKVKAEQETEINAKGPRITTENYMALQDIIRELTHEDTLILAGA